MTTEKVKKTIAAIQEEARQVEIRAKRGNPKLLREGLSESVGLRTAAAMLTTALADADAELAAKYKETGL